MPFNHSFVSCSYAENNKVLREGMAEMGFKETLNPEETGYIIANFYYPNHENFDFDTFYDKLYAKGMYIAIEMVYMSGTQRLYLLGNKHLGNHLVFLSLSILCLNDVFPVCKDICNPSHT